MEEIQSCDLVLIGHLSKDIIIQGGKEERLTGGAVVFASIAARRSGASVWVVTKLAPPDHGLVASLEAQGVRVEVLESAETTSIRNIYETEDREQRSVTLLAQAAPFRWPEIPRVKARIFYLAGLFAGEIPPELIPTLAQWAAAHQAEIALDAQGVLRHSQGGRLTFKDWPEKAAYLPRIAYLKTDAAEAEVLTGEADREKAAGILRDLGAREVMVTHHREVLVCSKHRFYRAPFTPRNLSGRTGRGDTCFAAYLTWRLEHDVAESVKYAAALTSLKMETPGPFEGSRRQVMEQM